MSDEPTSVRPEPVEGHLLSSRTVEGFDKLSPDGCLSLRQDFPGVGSWHYLDSAATAQKPKAVIDAIARAYGPDYATVHRGVYERSANMTLAYEAARRKVANFINAQSD